jgi:prepilin-type N-terminal cleavage/methylation domain-containing protein
MNLRKNENGFTIIELVIVIILIGVLVSIIIPTFLGQLEQADIVATKANAESIRTATRLFYAENNRNWPISIEQLVDSGYLRTMPEEMFTPTTQEVGTFDGTGGWVYQSVSDTEPPIINVNLSGNDPNNVAFTEY